MVLVLFSQPIFFPFVRWVEPLNRTAGHNGGGNEDAVIVDGRALMICLHLIRLSCVAYDGMRHYLQQGRMLHFYHWKESRNERWGAKIAGRRVSIRAGRSVRWIAVRQLQHMSVENFIWGCLWGDDTHPSQHKEHLYSWYEGSRKRQRTRENCYCKTEWIRQAQVDRVHWSNRRPVPNHRRIRE